MHKKIKSRPNSVNACYHSVERLLFFLLPRNVKVKIYRTIILPVVFLRVCETWSLTLREEHILRLSENRFLRRIYGPKKAEVTGELSYTVRSFINCTLAQISLGRSRQGRSGEWYMW
jgi:hypothetical protein